jgi:hypothetical protein
MGAVATEGARLAEAFRVAPPFLAVFRGPPFIYEFMNDAYLKGLTRLTTSQRDGRARASRT